MQAANHFLDGHAIHGGARHSESGQASSPYQGHWKRKPGFMKDDKAKQLEHSRQEETGLYVSRAQDDQKTAVAVRMLRLERNIHRPSWP